MDEMVFANYRPADNYIDEAVNDFRIDGEDGFGFIRDFVKERLVQNHTAAYVRPLCHDPRGYFPTDEQMSNSA